MMDEFPQFSKLPAELRLMIWKATVERRVVDAEFSPRTGRVVTSAAPPAIFHVNSESRAVAKELYEKIFWANENVAGNNRVARIYFNHEVDDLYLPFPNSPHNPVGVSFRDMPLLPLFPIQNMFPASVLDVGHLHGQASMRYDRAYEWHDFSESYSMLMSYVLTQGTQSLQRVNRVQVDDFYKGSRLALNFGALAAMSTYNLTHRLPELTDIVFRWSRGRIPNSLRDQYADNDRSPAHIHHTRDFTQLRLTRDALISMDALYGENQHGRVALRFEEVPQGRSYFLTQNGRAFDLNTEHGDWVFGRQAYLDRLA